MVLNDQECLLPARPISVMRLLLPDPNYQVAESECYTNSRCSRPMCGVAAGLSRPSKHLIRLAFTMRSTPHNVGHHESRFPSLGISAARTVLLELATKNGRGFPRPFCIADEAEPYSAACGCALETLENSFRRDQARSKRSSFITLVHAAAKSFANFSLASAQA